MKNRVKVPLNGEVIHIEPIQPQTQAEAHSSSVDIIICVHNVLADVKVLFISILKNTNPPHSLIFVNNGSDLETRDYLKQFAREHSCNLIENQNVKGYTRAVNQGLHQSTGDFVVLLNSDTIVTPGLLDRMEASAQSDPEIGIVGPLSNTASWQPIPKIEENGIWATNPLPSDLPIEEMGHLVTKNSDRLYPTMGLLNWFCLMIRRQAIEQVEGAIS